MMRSVLRHALEGAAAGLLATWAMDRVTTAGYRLEPEEARRREYEARGGRTADAIMLERTARRFGRDFDKEDVALAGEWLH